MVIHYQFYLVVIYLSFSLCIFPNLSLSLSLSHTHTHTHSYTHTYRTVHTQAEQHVYNMANTLTQTHKHRISFQQKLFCASWRKKTQTMSRHERCQCLNTVMNPYIVTHYFFAFDIIVLKGTYSRLRFNRKIYCYPDNFTRRIISVVLLHWFLSLDTSPKLYFYLVINYFPTTAAVKKYWTVFVVKQTGITNQRYRISLFLFKSKLACLILQSDKSMYTNFKFWPIKIENSNDSFRIYGPSIFTVSIDKAVTFMPFE